MPLCQKKKKQRPPIAPRQGPYTKVNAYTLKPSFQQILTFFLAMLVLILHSIFTVSPVTKISHPILNILLALHYLLVVALIYTYYKVTTFDPVDRLITTPSLLTSTETKGIKKQYCTLCRSQVRQKSYHCKRCNRCTEDFDHHCSFLNSCIGSRNYQLFMRILLLYILFLVNNVMQSIWVFVRARSSQEVRTASITQWMSIAIIVICVGQLIATIALLGFHCYISCCLDLTTIAFIQSQTNSNHTPTHYQSDSKKGDSVEVFDINQSPTNIVLKSMSNMENVQFSGHIV